MKKLTLIVLLAIISIANAGENREKGLEEHVQGNYFLLGKAIGNKDTYYGQISIKKVDSELQITRNISGEIVKGSAAIEHATPDEIPVLRMRFKDEEYEYESTCMVGSDLDNYARITCFLYIPGVTSMEPGMEALFINYNRPR